MTDRIFTGANGRKYINNEPRLHPPQRKPLTEERNFCSRCGKRTNDIHTCTPPLADGDNLSPTEPVAWMDIADDGTRLAVRMYSDGSSEEVPVYTTPPQRKPLTDDEIHDCWQQRHRDKTTERRLITRAIERAHGIKDAGCDHCNHPLYAAIKCRQCGRVTE